MESTPIAAPRTWLDLVSGWYWHEHRFHRGRIILRLYGTLNHEIRVDPPEVPAQDGRARVGAPYWIVRPRAEALEWMKRGGRYAR